MNNKQFLFAGTLVLLLLLGACTPKKAVIGDSLKENTPEAMMDKLVRNQVYAEWLDAKAKISYNDGYQTISANATIKMRKDSILWIAIKKLGFEVARM
ncbi:MAG: DUF4292 domain-containing protein, partial [Saprospiraceae bacterium]